MTEQANVRLTLDTSQAKSELGGFVRDANRMAGRVSSGIRSTIGKGLGLVGLDGTYSSALGAVRGSTESGVGDVIGEAFGGYGRQIEQFFLGNLGEHARAARSAREETISAFGQIAGARDAIPAGAKQFFNSVSRIHQQAERGRTLFETNDEFRGPGVSELMDRITNVLATELRKAVDYLWSKVPVIGG